MNVWNSVPISHTHHMVYLASVMDIENSVHSAVEPSYWPTEFLERFSPNCTLTELNNVE
jgi:hypothetical protein